MVDEIEPVWMKDLNDFYNENNKPRPPIILVGTKVDLRGEEQGAVVSNLFRRCEALQKNRCEEVRGVLCKD